MFVTDGRLTPDLVSSRGAHRAWGSFARHLLRWGPATDQAKSGLTADQPIEADGVDGIDDGDGMDIAAARTMSTAATAAAIRQQLISPGSLSPEEQIRLILADREAYEFPDELAHARYGERN